MLAAFYMLVMNYLRSLLVSNSSFTKALSTYNILQVLAFAMSFVNWRHQFSLHSLQGQSLFLSCTCMSGMGTEDNVCVGTYGREIQNIFTLSRQESVPFLPMAIFDSMYLGNAGYLPL